MSDAVDPLPLASYRDAGWALIPSGMDHGSLEQLAAQIQVSNGYAGRDLLRRSPAVAAWADSAPVKTVVTGLLGPRAQAISGMWFDKVDGANWRVPWHQDRHLMLSEFAAPGWGPWSLKDGLPYVAAPEPWASERVALRLHLDASGPDNGPLEILPGSHRRGILDPAGIEETLATDSPRTILAAPGEILVMHPLLLHRSAPAVAPSHRRVIHLEWCALPLPIGLSWMTP